MLLLHKLNPILSCNYPSLPNARIPTLLHNPRLPLHPKILDPPKLFFVSMSLIPRERRSSIRSSNLDTQIQEKEDEVGVPNGGDDGGGNNWNDWVTSGLLFGLWAGLMYYVFQLAPNQTPYRDVYFLQKLLNLRGDDGFKMNEVLVALWYIMGLWPLLYSMLLLPTGRSSRSKVPVWPFLVLSFFGGAYALIPYFVLWRPPPPPIEEEEISRWPLNFLESRITAAITLGAGLGLIGYAAIAGGDTWKEFYQYFRESKFIHATCIDFTLLSTFAPFWVYNDATARRWISKGSWLVPVALVPVVGPALYILLRPSLSSLPTRSTSTDEET
ncbi:transmembrane protein [Rhynchospora pubera]|uniref:Transmembrane protein n=1 Tax=Rhynchospora pubera TaxID=906938 RepID=A0AAV8F457_9POAL|nr:transmembrane protein [Rhynchospora pubera]